MPDNSDTTSKAPSTSQPRRKRGPVKKLIFAFVSVFAILCMLEGCATFALVTYDMIFWSEPVQTDRHHTEFDPNIGWVAVPNLDEPDIYGEGIGIKTNAQAFRNEQNTPGEVPSGKVRVVCSGDSFTFGYGVRNDETWVAQLAKHNDRLDPINIAMSGYGVDQMYLWYQLACREIKHDVHILSFISHDFVRARHTKMFGYNKPRLRANDNKLVIENTPVPESGFRFPWLTANAKHLQRSSLVDLVGKLSRATSSQSDGSLTEKEGLESFELILDELIRMNKEKSSKFVLVHLPTKEDYYNNANANLRTSLATAAQKRGILYIDLIESIRKVEAREVEKMFFRKGEVHDPGSAKHPSQAGHRFFAKEIYQSLINDEALKAQIEKP